MKYINADDYKKLIEREKAECYPTDDEFEDGCKTGLGIAVKVIDEMPSADVVEVVRCKDCKHFVETGGTRDGCFLFQGMTNPRSDDFCSEGERKETDD